MNLSFEWDEDKALLNFHKHGVEFEDAMSAFDDDDSLTITDIKHSTNEVRYHLLGQSRDKSLLVIVHTKRGENIRLISARTANKKERKTYEESKTV